MREIIESEIKVPYSFAPAHMNKQRAGALGALAGEYVREGRLQTAAEHQPDYLRMSQAERERAEKIRQEKESSDRKEGR